MVNSSAAEIREGKFFSNVDLESYFENRRIKAYNIQNVAIKHFEKSVFIAISNVIQQHFTV